MSMTYTYYCQHCGKPFSGYATTRRKFCDDKCRVAWHRLQKRPDAEKTLFILVSVINQKIERLQKAIEGRAARLPDAVGITKQSLQELIREDEKILEELQSLLTIKNNLELETESVES
jgi:hypothetical protein